MSEQPPEPKKENQKSPEQVIFDAFTVYNTDRLERATILNFAVAAGCPSFNTAERVLHNLVINGGLTYEVIGEEVWFTIAKPKPGKIE